MEELFKKLTQLNELLKALSKQPAVKPVLPTIPGIKPPAVPSIKAKVKETKMPAPAPNSKKDPKKIAQQIKDGSMSTKTQKVLLKIDQNGQWSFIEKADPDFRIPKKITYTLPHVDESHPTAVHAEYNGFGGEMNEAHPHQKTLIHGIDIGKAKPLSIKEGGITENSKWATNPFNNKTMIIKPASGAEEGQTKEQDKLGMRASDGLNAARREVLFHNVAHNLGLGQYVPTTAGFKKGGEDWSAQEKVDGTTTRNIDILNPEHKARYINALKNMHESGDLHKMAILDTLMGNHDRHMGNVMLNNKEDKLHMIDNARSIDYRNDEPRPSTYLRDAERFLNISNLHPEAEKWLRDLKPEDAATMLEKYVEPNSKFKGNFIKRLNAVKQAIDYLPDDGSVKLSEILRLVGEHTAKDRSKLAASRQEQSDLKKV